MKVFQIVLQFRMEHDGSAEEFDHLVMIEEELNSALEQERAGYVDGHDFGAGTFNVFVPCADAEGSEAFLLNYVTGKDWAKNVVIARQYEDETFEVIYPRGHSGKFELM